jgi:hypothetical protein
VVPRAGFLWVAGLAYALWATSAHAAATREEIKAALVYKFAQFVHWRADARPADSNTVVGLLDCEQLWPALEASLQGKQMHGSALAVRIFRRPEDVQDCGILLVGGPESRRDLVLSRLRQPGLLTIGEGSSFVRQGGVIAIDLDGPHTTFDVNLGAADRAGLTIDAALLGLAREVGRW